MSLLFENKITSIIIIFLLFKIKYNKGEDPSKKIINELFPNSIEINDNNILIIFQNGINIYNSNFTQKIYSYEYDSNFTLTKDDFDLINLSKFEDDIIIAIIKTYVYFFQPDGKYICHTNLNEDINGATYYSLIPFKIEGNNYYYAITYMESSSSLKIYYYKMNIQDKNNYKINYLQYSGSFQQKGLTCQLMIHPNIENVLTCFYETSSNSLAATSFILENNITKVDSLPSVEINNNGCGNFKSAANNDKTKTLICYSKYSSGGYCILYNILNNTFYFDKMFLNSCNDNPTRYVQVYYFTKTKEFIFSCAVNTKLTIRKINEDGNAVDSNESSIDTNYLFEGSNLISYSILFLSKNKKYSILYCDLNDGSVYDFLPDDFDPINIYDDIDNKTAEYKISTTIFQSTNAEEIIPTDIKSIMITSIRNSIPEYSNTESVTLLSTNIKSSNIPEFNITTDIQTESESLQKVESSLISELINVELSNKVIITENTKTNTNNEYIECSRYENSDKKCLYCNEESLKLNKCIECNNKLGYFPLNYIENNDEIYKECYNNQTKLSNFYFDFRSNSFNLCYELCNTCNNGGNSIENNCTSCISGYMLNPDRINRTNCVYNCTYYYYYKYGQYKCTDKGQCPLDNNLLIRPKNKCINNCDLDSIYKYQYNSECFEKCPNNTFSNSLKICEDNNTDICSLSIFNFDLNIQEMNSYDIELSSINYAREFSYTENHISQYNNELYSYILFKNDDCINKLSLSFSIIDFGSCYEKMQSYYNTTKKLIIALMNVKNDINKPLTLYEVFEPETGKRINIEKICKDKSIIIEENLEHYLKSSKDLVSEQNIDIFNLSGSFYTDICYHFKSPNKKDVPLKDRILTFYPNISFCDDGCIYKGVNLETLKAECECKIINFFDNYLLVNDLPLFDNIIGEAVNFIKESNILVLKCYKDLFRFKYYYHNKGYYIISSLILIQMLCSFIFFYLDLLKIKKYIYNLTNCFIKQKRKESNIVLNPSKKRSKTQIQKYNKKNKKNKTRKLKLKNSKINNINNFHENINSSSKNIILNEKRQKILNKKYKINSINLKDKLSNHYKLTNSEENAFKEYLSTDLDDLEFEEALEKDKRKLCEIFVDNIKNENLFIKTFFISDNIRPRSIKILLFLLMINLYFVTNALMYNEEYISKLYNSNEEQSFFNFLYNTTERLIYVSIINIVISYLIEIYFVKEKKLKGIFLKNSNILYIKYKICKLINYIGKSYKHFIILNYLIIIFSWYYIFCFNNVYPNTSLYWIKSSLFIIALIQLLSIIYIFIKSVIRLMSFICQSESIFKLSKILSD
mgnify:CR=1 FL=1